VPGAKVEGTPRCAAHLRRAKLRVVSVPDPVHVVLDIERTDGTVSGQVAVEGAHPASFYGWLELIHRLECAAGRHRLQPSTDTEQRGEHA
jgi:hypothetical protein